MFKLLLVLSVFAIACAAPGVVVAPGVVPVVHQPSIVHHQGAHAVHSHVIHHPPSVKAVVTPVVAKPLVHVVPVAKVVPVVKPIVPLVPVHHAHPAIIAHH